MKTIPEIQKYMTPMPITVNAEITIQKAFEVMREGDFRHLPVQKKGDLVGVVSDRDIKFAVSFGNEELQVQDVMTPNPYSVYPDTPIDEVVTTMSLKKFGCAIIRQRNGKIVGIFTAVDGLRGFAEILHKRYRFPS